MDWKYGSSGRMFAYHTSGPGLNLQITIINYKYNKQINK
jgi:hypothetical protein